MYHFQYKIQIPIFFLAKCVTGKMCKSLHNHSFKSVEKVANGKAKNPSKEPAPSAEPGHIKQSSVERIKNTE